MGSVLAPVVSVAALAALAVVSCGDGGVAQSFRTLEKESNRQAAIVCDCFEENGFESRADCRFSYAPLERSAEQERCIDDALGLDPTGAGMAIECELRLQREYTMCLRVNLVCPDPSSTQECDSAYFSAIGDCPSIPSDVAGALSACP